MGLASWISSATSDQGGQNPAGGATHYIKTDEAVIWVAFSPNGGEFASGSLQGTIRVWDSSSGKERCRLPGPKTAPFASVMCLAFSPSGSTILAGYSDGVARIWDLKSQEVIQSLKGHEGPVKSVAFFRDGVRVLTGSTSDFFVRMWDGSTGKMLKRFPCKAIPDGVTLTPDEQSFIVCEFRDVALWDIASEKSLKKFENDACRVESLAFLAKGARFVSCGFGGVYLWDIAGAKLLQKLGELEGCQSLAVSSDGDRMLVGGINRMELWDMKALKLMQGYDKLEGDTHVAISPDGKLGVSGEFRGPVRLWKLP